MIQLIQLFSHDELNKRIRIAASKIDHAITVNQTNADLYFSGVNMVWRDCVYFVDTDVVQNFYSQLHRLSINNFIIYVYSSEREIENNKKIEIISDYYLPVNFDRVQLQCALSVSKKSLLGYSQTVLTRKLLNTSVSEIEHLVDGAGLRFFWKNVSGVYVGSNQLFMSDFDLAGMDDLIGKTDSDLLDEQSALAFSAFDQQILKNGQAFTNIEKEIVFKNGDRQWLSFAKYPHLRDGVIIGIVGLYQLISEKKSDIQNPLSEQTMLRALMDNMPDSIYFKDKDSRFISINNAQAQLIGVDSESEAIGKTDFDFFDEEIAKVAFANEQKILFERSAVNQIEKITKNGKTKWLYSIKVPIIDEKNVAVGTVGISRDVSDIVKANKVLSDNCDSLQQLIDHIPFPIFYKNIKSEYTRVNKSLAGIMGAHSTSQMIGKTDYDFFPKNEADIFRNTELTIFETGESIVNNIEKSFSNDNEVRWHSTTKIPIRDDDDTDRIIGLVGVAYDITEQVIIKQQLKESISKKQEQYTEKNNLLSNMSHEIRTPINGIIGISKVLELQGLNPDQLRLLSIIKKSGYDLLTIINDILDLSRIENGRMKIIQKPFDFYTTIKAVEESMQNLKAEKNNQLFFNVDELCKTPLIGDEFRLKQVFDNLINNALKFTSNGVVTVDVLCTHQNNKELGFEIKVHDTGIGLSNNEIHVIFASFTQVDSSTTRKYGGSGLGLAICSNLIEMMGGELKVDSQKGVGSTFYFSIVLEKDLKN